MNKKYLVTNIEWDTDGEDVDLPNELEIILPDDEELTSPEEIEHYISEAITNETGFCHFGFATEPEIYK